MQEENISEKESLQIIESMINKAKNQFSENGHLYLLWGWTVLICSLSQFILMYFVNFEKHYLVWLATWLVFFYQIFYLRKERRRQIVRTYTDSIIGFVWITFVILMFLFGFLFGRVMGEDYYYFMYPGFLALYGMPTFLSGIILRFKPLVIGGICCWILSIVSAYTPADFQLLLIPVAMIAAWIIPGYRMKAKYKLQKA